MYVNPDKIYSDFSVNQDHILFTVVIYTCINDFESQ